MENKGRKLTFGQRMGFEPVSERIWVDEISIELRTQLYNFYHDLYYISWLEYRDARVYSEQYNIHNRLENVHHTLWQNFFKGKSDEFPDYWSMIKVVKKLFFEKTSPWYKIYQFIEDLFSICKSYELNKFVDENIIFYLNSKLEEFMSGYRFYDGQFIPITNSEELASMNQVQQSAAELGLTNIKSHFSAALHLLSDKENPDYRNSIKESISMVEAVARLINPKGNTLGKALNKLEQYIYINPQLKEGFNNMYNFTNSKEGIRHAMMEEKKDITMEDARYMLISCSAFTNYLIDKARKEGILGHEDG